MGNWNYDAMESGYLDDKGRIQRHEPECLCVMCTVRAGEAKTGDAREFVQEQIDRLSRKIMDLLQTGGNLTKLNEALVERAKLERVIERG